MYNLIENRNIRLFISSTFQDLNDERDYLMRRTFPELRNLALKRNVTLTELDLRWGITPEEARRGDVIRICFREIEKSIPFFIGIIGKRYGWCPEAEEINERTMYEYPEIENYIARNLSVTEMEMQFGVLERKETMNAFFYINSSKDLCSDNPSKLNALKRAVYNNHRYPVYEYTTKEQLSNLIKEAFINLLDQLFPEEVNINIVRFNQNIVKRKLCEIYVPDENLISKIDEWFQNKNLQYCAFIGESGSGKSAFIANWVHNRSNTILHNTLILDYYIGAGIENNAQIIIESLCNEIKSIDNSLNDCPNDLSELFEKFSSFNKNIIIILDGINQIEDSNNAKSLSWLPILPKNIRIIFTSTEDDEIVKTFERKKYPIISLNILEESKKLDLIKSYLGKYAKKLNRSQLELILQSDLCQNPLAIRTLLDELIRFGIFENIDEILKGFLSCLSLEDFYNKLLLNYESDYGCRLISSILGFISISRKGVPESIIISLLSIRPIVWSQFKNAFERNFLLTNGRLSFSHSFVQSAVKERYLNSNFEKELRNKYLQWHLDHQTNTSFIEIPFQLYKLNLWEKLFEFISDLKMFKFLYANEYILLLKYWNELIKLDSNKFSFLHIIEEENKIKRHYSDAFIGEVFNLIGLFIHNNFTFQKDALTFYYSALKHYSKIYNENGDIADIYNNIGSVLLELGQYDDAISIYHKVLDIRKGIYGEHSLEVASSYNNIATVYSETDGNKAFPYFEKSLKIRMDIEGFWSADVANSYNNIAGTYLKISEFNPLPETKLKEVEQMLINAINIHLECVGNIHRDLALYYHNMALTEIYLNKFEEAKIYLKRGHEIEKVLYVYNHPNIAGYFHLLGGLYMMQYKYEDSIESLKKCVEILKNIYGEKHFSLEKPIGLIATNYIHLNQYENANEYLLYEANLYEGLINPTYSQIQSKVGMYNDIGFNYYSLGNYHAAIDYYQKAIEILDKEHDCQFHSILLNNIARAYFKLRNFQESLSFQQLALSIQLENFGENNLDTARSYNNIGLIYLDLNELFKAEELLRKALNIRLSLPRIDYLALADSYKNLGLLFLRKNQFEEAFEDYTRSYEIYLKILGPNHPNTLEMRNKLSILKTNK